MARLKGGCPHNMKQKLYWVQRAKRGSSGGNPMMILVFIIILILIFGI